MAQQWRKLTKSANGDAASSISIHEDADSGAVNGTARPGLRTSVLVLVILGLLVGLYGGMLRDLAWQWWDDPNYTHGFLVPLFSGLLVWQRRQQLAALPPRGSWIGLSVLLAGLGALLLGDLAAENFLMRSS